MRTIHSKTLIPVLFVLGIMLGSDRVSAQPVKIIDATNTFWRYKTNSFDPGYVPADAWVAPGFVEDSTWLGPSRGLFGQEAAGVYPFPINTTILAPANSDPDTISSYFRTHFTWNGPTQGVTLVTTNYIDDALIVYLNGVEIYEFNTPATRPLAWNNPTMPGGANPGGEPVIHRTNIVVNLLSGDNVLAVQLQQHTSGQPGSSDDVFGMWMYGLVEFAPIIVDPTQPTNRVVMQSRPTTLLCLADAFPAPSFQWFKDGTAINPAVNATATSASYVITNMSSTDAGDYRCVVTNPLGSTNSRTATVGYTIDTVAPRPLYAVGSPGFNTIYIQFDEQLEALTATDGANYSISPSLNQTANPVLANGGKAVVLSTDPQTQGATYTITINDVRDFAGNPIAAPNNTAQFRAWVSTTCGGLTFEVYNGTPGPTLIGAIVSTAVSVLTNHPTFPNSPSEVFKLNTFTTREVYPNDTHENYGGRIRGFFIPPESGNWKFYMRGDDGAEVWFNPNGTSPAGRIRICAQAGFIGGAFGEEAPGTRTSAPIPLNAGQAYYIEALYQEQGGGDYCEVAAKLETDPTPAASLTPIPGSQLGSSAAPPDVVGPVLVTQQPASRTNQANTKATFTVAASNGLNSPICYQWQKSDDGGANFADIPGATGPSFTTGYLKLPDDNGDVYRVVVAVIGSSATSANAILTVTADTTRPRVTRVLGLSTTNIAVFYSEPMPPQIEGGTVDDPFAYALGGSTTPATATINPSNPLRVDLSLDSADAMTLGTAYTLRISTDATAIMDANMNLIDPNPTIATFRAQLFTGDANNLPELPTGSRLPVGALTARGFAGRIVQVPVTIVNANSVAESILAGTFINPGTGLPALNIAPLPVFYETNIINYNKDMPTNVYAGTLTPDVQFPGYPPNPTGAATAGYENMTMEVVTYLHLHPGIHSFGVNSDDGFRVSPATSVDDPNNSITLGEFNGGRGAADTIFSFFVSQEGLYPFRLMWEQGQGGGNVEWWAIDLNTTGAPRSAINANVAGVAGGPGGGGPPAFTPPCTPKTLSVSLSGTNLLVSWPIAGGGNLFGLQGTPSLNPAIAWSSVPQTPTNIAGNKRATVPLSSGNRFYRLFKAAPPNCN